MRHLLKRNYDYWNHERSLTALLIYMVIAILCWITLGDVDEGWFAYALSDLVFYMIILAAVFSVYVEWRAQFLFITVTVGATVVRPLTHFYSNLWLDVFNMVFAFLFFSLLARLVLSRVFKKGPITFYRIQGSIVIFLALGLMSALLYTILERVSPGAFVHTTHESNPNGSFSQMLYFSFVTMTTMGIGDMVPGSPLAKALVVLQGMIGLLYPVIMIARLVSFEVSHSAHRSIE